MKEEEEEEEAPLSNSSFSNPICQVKKKVTSLPPLALTPNKLCGKARVAAKLWRYLLPGLPPPLSLPLSDFRGHNYPTH